MASISYLRVAKKILFFFLALKSCTTLSLDCGRGNVFIENETYILVTCILTTDISAEAVYWSKFDDRIGFCYLPGMPGGLCYQSQGSGFDYNLQIRNDSFSLGIDHEPTSSDYGEYYISFGRNGEKILGLNFTSFHRDNHSDSLSYTTPSILGYLGDVHSFSGREIVQFDQKDSMSTTPSTYPTAVNLQSNSIKSLFTNYRISHSSGKWENLFLVNCLLALSITCLHFIAKIRKLMRKKYYEWPDHNGACA